MMTRLEGGSTGYRHGALRWLTVGAGLIVLISGCARDVSVSGFKPLEPVQQISFWHADRLSVAEVDSLRPTIRWEPFPGRHEIPLVGGRPYVDVDPARIDDVTYDLRIWRARNDHPQALVYERRGLADAVHPLDLDLDAATTYFWSVRARFRVDGLTRLTDWSLSQIPYPYDEVPSNLAAFGTLTTRDVATRIGRIQFPNYFRFRTPRA